MTTITKVIRYDLTAADHLTGPMTAGARATDRVASSMDAASRSARVLDRALQQQRKATDVAAGASLALARADEILKEAEHGLADGALEAEFALKKQAEAAKKAAVESAAAGVAAKGAGGGFAALAGSKAGGGLGGGMGAVAVAGLGLAPILTTVGVGLGGVALAAAGVAKPIEKAAQKTGGLRANLKMLDPEQRAVAVSLLGLGQQYDAFQRALKPEVLSIFNQGISIAGHLLTDVQPVAVATGKAFSGFLGQLDKTFASGEFQQFFAFMAKTAAPDMQLLGTVLINVVKDLPPLLEQLQPLGVGILNVTNVALKFVGALEKVHLIMPVLGAAIGFMVAGPLGALIGASIGAGVAVAGLGNHAEQVTHKIQVAGQQVSQVAPQIARFGTSAGGAATQTDKAGTSAQGATPKLTGMASAAYGAAQKVQSLAQQVNGLTNAENKALTPLLTYTNAVLSQRNDANSLTTALKASGDRIGLNSAAQRASFSAANTYIQDLLNTAAAAQKSHQGLDAQISSIQRALPALQNVKGGTAQYWQEVRTLVGWLAKLQQMKLIQEKVHITGDGQWAFVQGGGGNMRLHSGNAATGMLVRGGIPGKDSVLIKAMPGELIVPTAMVSAGEVDHLRGKIPGFAQGGIVPSYSGSVGGLQPWGAANWQSTVSQIATAIAKAMAAQVKAAVASSGASGAPGGMGGPASAGAAQAQAYARSRLGAFGWGPGQMPPLIALWNGESGWNRLARNPASGAYGIPQALPGSKMGAAANPPTSSAAAQINWGLGYIKSTPGYGSPSATYAKWLSRSPHWYDQGGLLMPGLTLAMNGTGQPEHVFTGEGVAGMLDQLTQILGAIQQLTTVVSSTTGGGVSGPPGGIPVAGYPGIVVPTGGGFGLTRGDLGLPPPSSGSGGGDTGGGGDTSGGGTGTPSPGGPKGKPRPAPNLSRTAAIKVLTSLLARDITHNRLAAAQQDNALLDWLGVHSHDKTLREIAELDHLLLAYRKAKKTKAAAATEQLLRSFGVHDFTPSLTVKGNPAKKAVTARLEQVMRTYIAENDLRGARQDNALLTHLGVGKYTGVIGQITMFDRLLAQYKKKKDAKDVRAVEQVLRSMGVRKFARGGWITEPVTGIGASGQMYQFAEAGRPELVIPAAGASAGGHGDMAAELRALRRELRGLTDVARAIPAATGRHVAAGVNGGTADAVFRARYP